MNRVLREDAGKGLLVVASVVVGASIVLNGSLSRALNGLAGFVWFSAAAVLVVVAKRAGFRLREWSVVLVLTALVAFVVKPSDLVLATIGFGLAGAIVAWVAPRRETLASLLVVGLYLPFHIGAAVLKALGRSLAGNEATIRTEPPPTAAIVPLVMLLAALLGAEAVRRFRQERWKSNQDAGSHEAAKTNQA